jgi:hypothetical protein
LRAGGRAELLAAALDVRLHRASRDSQGVGDLLAGSPDGRERQHLALAQGQCELRSRGQAAQLQHPVEGVKRHEVERGKIALRQIDLGAAEPRLAGAARWRDDRDHHAIHHAEVAGASHELDGARLPFRIVRRFPEPAERLKCCPAMTQRGIVPHILRLAIHIEKAGRQPFGENRLARRFGRQRGDIGTTEIVEAVLAERAAHRIQNARDIRKLPHCLDEIECSTADHVHRRLTIGR